LVGQFSVQQFTNKLMPITLIVSLLTTFGPGAVQLITTLIAGWESNQTITQAQWAALAASLNQTAHDKMLAQLAAAGIDPASPQGVAMLALAGK
jgi:sensor domain CHASE-containing protein